LRSRGTVGSMRILVHEFVTGGGLAGRPVPASLAREGAAMRNALVTDLAALRRHQIVTTVDRRFPLGRPPAGVEVVTLSAARPRLFDDLLASVDAVWLVAPETGGCLERLAERAAKRGAVLVGPSAAAIRTASDKAGLGKRLSAHGVPYPETRLVSSTAEARTALREMGLPLVVKPRRGAGGVGVTLMRGQVLNHHISPGQILIQRFVPGIAASVSLLTDGKRATVLAVNSQSMRAVRVGPGRGGFAYRGGITPFAHPLAPRAAVVARRACRALPGLRGYVGVDVVLTESEAVVIEVNPRLTTSYLGLRSALDSNVAGLALAACSGRLRRATPARRAMRFTASGRVYPA